MQIFIPASAYDRNREVDTTYNFNPASNYWIATDFDCVTLSTDDEGFPVLHSDMGECRMGGTIHSFHADDTVTETPVPIEPSDFLPAIALAYPEIHKEGFTYVWKSRDELTEQLVGRLAAWHGLQLTDLAATVLDLKDQLEECFVQDEES